MKDGGRVRKKNAKKEGVGVERNRDRGRARESGETEIGERGERKNVIGEREN